MNTVLERRGWWGGFGLYKLFSSMKLSTKRKKTTKYIITSILFHKLNVARNHAMTI